MDCSRFHGAGGELLQYSGYVEITVEFPDLGTGAVGALVLVVPATTYHGQVPFLVATNLLKVVLSLQPGRRDQLPTPWQLAFKGLLHQQQIEMTNCPLGSVKTTKQVAAPAGGRIMVRGITHAASADCMKMSVLVEEPKVSSLPSAIVVSPGFFQMRPGVTSHRISVEVRNCTEHDITIPAKVNLRDISQASWVPPLLSGSEAGQADSSRKEFRQQFDESLQTHLDDIQVQEMKTIFSKWRSVFCQHPLDLGRTDLVKHHIRLRDDTTFKERHRRIPPTLVEDIRQHLQEILDLGIIRRSENPFASYVVLVRKKDQSLRFCIDLRKLNNRTIKERRDP